MWCSSCQLGDRAYRQILQRSREYCHFVGRLTQWNGTFHAPLNSFKRYETTLRKAQQAVSRKTRFSHNWKKAKARVQCIHSRIGNARRDYLHKTSTTISQTTRW
ncbi:transposase, partial [Azotobacter salinestris]